MVEQQVTVMTGLIVGLCLFAGVVTHTHTAGLPGRTGLGVAGRHSCAGSGSGVAVGRVHLDSQVLVARRLGGHLAWRNNEGTPVNQQTSQRH